MRRDTNEPDYWIKTKTAPACRRGTDQNECKGPGHTTIRRGRRQKVCKAFYDDPKARSISTRQAATHKHAASSNSQGCAQKGRAASFRAARQHGRTNGDTGMAGAPKRDRHPASRPDRGKGTVSESGEERDRARPIYLPPKNRQWAATKGLSAPSGDQCGNRDPPSASAQRSTVSETPGLRRNRRSTWGVRSSWRGIRLGDRRISAKAGQLPQSSWRNQRRGRMS